MKYLLKLNKFKKKLIKIEKIIDNSNSDDKNIATLNNYLRKIINIENKKHNDYEEIKSVTTKLIGIDFNDIKVKSNKEADS